MILDSEAEQYVFQKQRQKRTSVKQPVLRRCLCKTQGCKTQGWRHFAERSLMSLQVQGLDICRHTIIQLTTHQYVFVLIHLSCLFVTEKKR